MSQYGKPLSCWGSQYFTGKPAFNIIFEKHDRTIQGCCQKIQKKNEAKSKGNIDNYAYKNV